MREEIFGPVAAVVRFTDDDDIVRIANDTVYGLAANVFSKDIQRALSVAHRLQAGTVGVCDNVIICILGGVILLKRLIICR